ncbi:Glycosyl hydrolase OS=Streptomyces antimycoticus OX=68175 GN=SSPO_026450 PE=3 SV=1 [Streptomyces antimycoticus]
MISHYAYAVEPWCLRETELNLDVLAQSESVFSVSNGHVGWRGNLDEGEPHALPGSYLNGVHEQHPLPYAEAGYGFPESGQTMINVTNGKLIRLLVDDEPFDLRYGRLRSHERVLDLRTGLLHRVCEWTSPVGKTVRVRSTRLVSFTQRAIAAVAYEVEAVDARTSVVVQSELVANEQLPALGGDPRVGAALKSCLRPEEHAAVDMRLRLVHHTAASNQRIAAAADHEVRGPGSTRSSSESADDVGRFTVSADLDPGETLRIEKFVSYGWSGIRSLPAVRDQVEAALTGARNTGWQGLVDQQREYLDGSGTVPISRSTATRKSSRRSASPSSMCCEAWQPVPEQRVVIPAKARADRLPGTTDAPSGTPRRSCSPLLRPTPRRTGVAEALHWRQTCGVARDQRPARHGRFTQGRRARIP